MAYEAKTKSDLKYSKTHEWIRVEGNEAYVGISDYAQHHLGAIVFVDLPSVGSTYSKDEEFGAVESVKAASDIYLPVSGEILDVNEELNDEPGKINDDCYANHIAHIKLDDANELEDLMDEKAYIAFCENEK